MKVTSFLPYSSTPFVDNHNNVHFQRRKSSSPVRHQRHYCLTSIFLFLLVNSSQAWFTFYSSQLASNRNYAQQSENTTSSVLNNTDINNNIISGESKNRTKRDAEEAAVTAEPLPTPLPRDLVEDEAELISDNNSINNVTSLSNSSDPIPCPWFTCRNGRCVMDVWRCDLQDDCGDGSDEEGCDQLLECPPPINGGKPAFRCKSGMCISSAWICDHFKDCPNGDDEDNCP